MFGLATFLMRWIFLSNLVRNIADIQTLPFQPYQPPPPPPPPPPTSSRHSKRHLAEEIWKDQCIRGILSYPPGPQRAFVIDALRTELVQQLCKELYKTDTILRKHAAAKKVCADNNEASSLLSVVASVPEEDAAMVSPGTSEDPFLDADLEIVREFEKITGTLPEDSGTKTATLSISDHETKILESTCPVDNVGSDLPTTAELMDAYRNALNFRECLPQLVASVLKSPPPFDPHISNPIERLRQVLLRQCLHDPSWGVELCWLLEAEVGRAWKTLFEHRQQIGRRLIVILPAEKAAVLAKIGNEKREAFDLLQDAEQATAYGYTVDDPEYSSDDHTFPVSRLPSSIGVRRCSHFGDTMHFIDRLTKVSADLRQVPVSQRKDVLHEHLYEMNRRIRRRMVTNGQVSLDVEDNRSPYDWPHLTDLKIEDIQYSVHLPLFPQIGKWPNGREASAASTTKPPVDYSALEVVRVLNIVVPESRLLASRERCPFLVHLEVADTGLEGHDARLYACGAQSLGSTVEEALGMGTPTTATEEQWRSNSHTTATETHIPYEIPPELLEGNIGSTRSYSSEPLTTETTPREPYESTGEYESTGGGGVAMETNVGKKKEFPRGGWQSEEEEQYNPYYGEPPDEGYIYTNPVDVARQHEYEQLHHQMQAQRTTPFGRLPAFIHRHPHAIGHQLLDNVFGEPWSEKCNQIRATSPYGHLKGWRLASFILKAGEDIRREALVMQIISKMRNWFEEEIPAVHRPFMRPYTIMCVGGEAGLLECLSDAKSIDEVKKRTDGFVSLRNYFERAYMPGAPEPLDNSGSYSNRHSISFETAQDNFLRSLVGYSLVCYVLQIKDRHNANILLDREGHIMHIDFGFVLGDTPKMGKVPIFSERAPFKLSGEFWEVLGGWNVKEGGLGVKFCKMFELAFHCASMHADEIAALVESTMLALDNNPRTASMIANGVRSRLRMRGPPGSTRQKMFIVDLVNAALTSWGTSTYDWLQKNMNGYQ